MEVSGSYTLYASRERVWEHLLDPMVLKRIIPGCEMLELEAPDHFRGRVNIGVAAVRGTYEGTLHITERVEPEHVCISGEGAGVRGVMHGEGVLTLEARAPATTIITYVGEAQPGGTLASVGMRVLGGVARMLINQFFARLADELDVGAPVAPDVTAGESPQATIPNFTSGGRANQEPHPIEQALPEAIPLDADDARPEARTLEQVATRSTPWGANQSVAGFSSGNVETTTATQADVRKRVTARSLARRAGLTDGSIESEQQLLGRIAVLVGLVAGVLLAAATFLTRRNRMQ